MKLYDLAGLFIVLLMLGGGIATAVEKDVAEEPQKIEAEFDLND